jgi:hypothetical protein
MNDERWQDLKDKIEMRFGGFDYEVEELPIEDDLGHQIPQKVESLMFKSDEMGELKIERSSHPKIIDRKAHYHKGAGGADVEYVASEDEFTYKVAVFKKDDFTGEWKPLDLPAERLSF